MATKQRNLIYRERYCECCEEFFELGARAWLSMDDRHPACGAESVRADSVDMPSDYEIYAKENPR
jgi:hypothetical protein